MFRMRAYLTAANDSCQTLKSRLGFKSSGRERPANKTAQVTCASCGGAKEGGQHPV